MKQRSQKKIASKGMTALEVLIAVVILIILATLSAPSIIKGSYKGRAASILTELETLKKAAFDYYTDHNSWPDPFYQHIPRDFRGYLPTGFTLGIPKWDITFRFHNYSWFEDRAPRFWKTWRLKYEGFTAGISVSSRNARLVSTLFDLAPRFFKQKHIEEDWGRMVYILE